MKTKIQFITLLCLTLCISGITASMGQTQPEKSRKGSKTAQITHDNRQDHTITVEGVRRHFIVHTPERYTGEKPVPLVVMLHGTGGDGERFWKISGWKEKAEKEGFIAVFPSALKYCYIEEENGIQVKKNKTKWLTPNVAEKLCPGETQNDDVAFLNAMLDDIEANYFVNGERIYFSGFSNGGGFVRQKVVPEMNDRVAAASSVGGLLREPIEIDGRLMPLFTMMGELDQGMIEYFGVDAIPMDVDISTWNTTMYNQLQNVLETLKLSERYESVEKDRHTTLRFAESLSGQDNVLLISIIKNLKHKYPNGTNNPEGVVAVNVFWPFFEKYHLNTNDQ